MFIEILHELSRLFEPNHPKNSGAQVWQLEYFPLYFVISVTNICPSAKLILPSVLWPERSSVSSIIRSSIGRCSRMGLWTIQAN